MKLIPIRRTLAENANFAANPACAETLEMSVGYYDVIGYEPPWICYYAEQDGRLVGSAAFKGPPVDGRIEIAYGTFESERGKGVGAAICKTLVEVARAADPSVRITARTLPEPNHSTRILERNGFTLVGTVHDKDDGDVWEWIIH
jgi:RimJ/RimL family protein N-acetyltransferase